MSEQPEVGAALAFEKEYEYDNGDAYRVWVFQTDRSDIPIERVGMGKMHVLAGDKLVQDEDEGRPFRIKRRSRTVAQKEWWQIEDLFVDGLPSWSGEEPESTEDAECNEPRGLLRSVMVKFRGETVEAWEVITPVTAGYQMDLTPGAFMFRWKGTTYIQEADGTLHGGRVGTHQYDQQGDAYDNVLRWHRIETDPEWRDALRHIGPRQCDYGFSVDLAVEDIPGTLIRRGDLVLVPWSRSEPEKWDVRGRIAPLPRDQYELVRAHLERRAGAPYGPYAGSQSFDLGKPNRDGTARYLPLVDISPQGFGSNYGPAANLFANRGKWGKRQKVWRPIAYVLKPVKPERVAAIKASSTDAALFELLSQVGGRMPRGGAA